MSSFHPDSSLLVNYNAGNTSSALALAVSVHLSFCHQCRQQMRQLTALGGSLLEQITPASLDEQGFEQLMTRLDSEPNAPFAKANSSTPSPGNPLLNHLPADLEQLPWHRQTKSIFTFDLSSVLDEPGFRVALQKINAGARVPTHTHGGAEYTVILKGGFSDEFGVYSRGDFIARDQRHEHTPTALQSGECICLTVLGAALRFTGWQRIFNPFIAWR